MEPENSATGNSLNSRLCGGLLELLDEILDPRVLPQVTTLVFEDVLDYLDNIQNQIVLPH